MKPRTFLYFFTLLLCLLILVYPAFACKCTEVGLEHAFKNAAAVFVGRVDEQKPSGLKSEYQEVKFVVFKRFKGFEELDKLQFVLIHTPREKPEAGDGEKTEIEKSANSLLAENPVNENIAKKNSGCGFQFINGFEYLVFAEGSPALLKVSKCTRTKLLDDAQLELKNLTQMLEQSNNSGD